MRIDDNTEALAMMKNALGSLEDKFREAYNKGFHDGRKEGRNEAKREMADKILREVEDESNCSEKPNNSTQFIEDKFCEDCKNFNPLKYSGCALDGEECRYEPKTDCCETCKHKDDRWDSEACDPCSRAESNYEPLTGK